MNKRIRPHSLALRLIAVSVLLYGAKAEAVNYYVSPNGNDANAGTSISAPWRTIQKAANTAIAGDRVYIRSGAYRERVTFPRSGTATNPIVFEGYRTTPGDNPDLGFRIGDALNPNIMPLLIGENTLPLASPMEVALSLKSVQYITLKNLQLKNYRRGISLTTVLGIVLENIIGIGFGRADDLSYNGEGLHVYGAQSSTFRRIIIGNAAAQNMTFICQQNLVEDCLSFCNDNQVPVYSATDYYFIVTGPGNIFNRCRVERVGDLDHPGHGIMVKQAGNNQFNFCTAVNLGEGIHLQGPEAVSNSFKDCQIIDSAVMLNEAAHYNSFHRCWVLRSPVTWRYTAQLTDLGEASIGPGYQNYFYDCVFEDVIEEAAPALHYDRWTTQADAYPAQYDRFNRCHFKNYYVLFYTQRQNYATTFTDCTFERIMHFLKEGNYPLRTPVFQGCNFIDCGFPTPLAPAGRTPNTGTPPGSGFPPTDISSGLVGHWRFDESSGSIAYDSGSSQNAGTLMGNARFDARGKIGRCIYLDGDGDYVTFGDVNDLTGGSLTVTAWVKADSWVHSAGIVTKFANGGNYRLLVSGERVSCLIRSAANADSQLAFYHDNLKTNRWYHVAMVFDEQTKWADLYVDGILRSYRSYDITRGGTAAPLEVGRDYWNGNLYFKGYIDDVRVYNRALNIYDLKTLAETF
jgi:hypothetical protein